MKTIEFKDKTELVIVEGASLSHIVTEVDTFADLQRVSDTLTKEGNLDVVQFKTDGEVSGSYEHMALVDPLFHVCVKNEKIQAAFSLREKTEMEKEMEALKKSQEVQDGAIMELAGMVGGV